MRGVMLGLLLLAGSGFQASAQQKFALLISQAAYQDAPLKTPPADVRMVGKRLAASGFSVTYSMDEKKKSIEKRIEALLARVNRGDVGLLWFAGHGVQVNDSNYLIPIDARINSEKDVERNAIGVQSILDRYKAQVGNFIVVLDACRNDPLKGRVEVSKRGLAIPKSLDKYRKSSGDAKRLHPMGVFLVYSTEANQTAEDGTGNSPFAEAFDRALRSGPQSMHRVFGQTRSGTVTATQSRQVPQTWDAFNGELLLNGDK